MFSKSSQNPDKLYPSYLNAFNNSTLGITAKSALKMLESCLICPRKCKVNRLKNELGFCKTGSKARVYSFSPHHGEEPPISGTKGSGTIFFSRCNMACVYCQNYKFSQTEAGKEVGREELAEIMLQLQKEGCHNINLVTPTHVLPQILEALNLAIPKGLKIPLVYNTSGYELRDMIKLLSGIVDIYLEDMRYGENEMAVKYSLAPGYPQYNQEATLEMHRQTGVAEFDDEGIITKGLIIRHLVLPNKISGTQKVMEFIAEKISPETYISLMSQYFPYFKAQNLPGISRRISLEEYLEAKKIMKKCGLHNGWTQDSHGLIKFAGVNIKPK